MMKSFFSLAALIIQATSLALAADAVNVTLTEDSAAYTLANGIITARISKTGAVTSLRYKDLELLGEASSASNSNGYWSLPGTQLSFGPHRTTQVLENTEDRVRVSCGYIYDGGERTAPADVELIYTLERSSSALYLEAHWRHRAEYPELTFPVGRFAAKLNDELFDWMTVDARRSFKMLTAYDWNHGTPLNLKEARLIHTGVFAGRVEHKYDYAAVQFDTPAYGWSSTAKGVGLWMVTAGPEYMSGGPTKLELSVSRDAIFTDTQTGPAPPTLLNVWKGPHYGGTSLVIAQGEEWNKVIGPFLLYCNSGDSPQAMHKDALQMAATESKRWPYAWAAGVDYPAASQRGGVNGRLVLKDPEEPTTKMSHAMVGLTHADYSEPNGAKIDWQKDGKYYQHWVRADDRGNFQIGGVRPGSYTLHAFADGVLGEYVKADVTIAAGKVIQLGELTWTPVRYGRQIWDIGIPDRTAAEFRNGDNYWRWGIYARYPKDFPDDVTYTVGKSDYHRDWNLMQVPRAANDTGKGRGTATTWSIQFDMPTTPKGTATLRLAFAGTETSTLRLAMNGIVIGPVTGLPDTGVIRRDSDRGWWQERAVTFDASFMRAGVNTLQLTVPAGNVTAGVEYDYLRLELDDRK